MEWGITLDGLPQCLRIAESYRQYRHVVSRARWTAEKLANHQRKRLRYALISASRDVPFHRRHCPAEPRALTACPCGSGLPTLRTLEGRQDDLLRLASGRRVTPQAIYNLFCAQFQLRRYRRRQHKPGDLTLEIDYSDSAVSDAGARLQSVIGSDDRLTVRRVDLTAPKTGKERIILIETP